MAGRGKEICVILLDTGPKMKDCVQHASTLLSNFLTSKMINKPSHEAALIVYGTDGSANPLYEEFSSEGDDTQYRHITQLHPFSQPSMDHLASLADLRSEQGKSDFVDALICATDIIYRALNDRPQLEAAVVKKRIVLVTNFLDAAKEDEDWEFVRTLTSKLQQQDILLDVVSIDEPGPDASFKAEKRQNKEALDQILPHVRHKVHSVRTPGEILSAFPYKEYSTTAYYSGPLTIANEMTIAVKVAKKSSKEGLPTFGKFSSLSIADDATHSVSYDRSFKAGEGDKEEEVAPEDVGKAYKYGSQILPVPKEAELAMKYAPEKSFQVIGVVPQDSVSHSLFMKDSWIVAPEKGNNNAFCALAAICTNLRKDRTALLARFLPRVNGDISIGFMTPYPSSRTGAKACLIMNVLPFEADLRQASFTAFSQNPDLLPHKDQTAAIEGLIEAFTLQEAGCQESLAPEKVTNPVLSRFCHAIRDLAIDAESPIPEEAPLLDLLLNPPKIEARDMALGRVAKQFAVQIKDNEGLAAAEVAMKAENRSGDASGLLEEFEQLLDSRKVDDAITGLVAACEKAIAREDSAASRMVARLRGGCIEFKKPKEFNSFLQASADDTKESQADFWRSLGGDRSGLISVSECAGGATEEATESFLRSLPSDKA